jgi:hypothetical protein
MAALGRLDAVLVGSSETTPRRSLYTQVLRDTVLSRLGLGRPIHQLTRSGLKT